jgi:hypothetical protein
MILALAREFHKLPEEIEAMDAGWFAWVVEFMEGEAINRQRIERERERRAGKR